MLPKASFYGVASMDGNGQTHNPASVTRVMEGRMRTAPGWIVRLSLGMAALSGFTPVTQAAPRTCDLALSASPASIPAGARRARVTIPVGTSDVQVRASSGTVTSPMRSGPGALTVSFTAAPDSAPVVLVAAVGVNVCGSAVIRVPPEGSAPATRSPASVLVVEPPSLPADRDGEAFVYVFAVDGLGSPRRGSPPAFRSAVGTVTGIEPISPGVWRGRWRVPAGEASAIGVEAAFGPEAGVSASLGRMPGEPLTIEIAQDQAGAAGSGGAPGAVLVRIRDSAGNLTDGSLALESEEAVLATPIQLERGVYRVPLEVRPGTRGGVALVTARAGRAIATATLSIAPPVAAVVRVTPPGPIRTDRSSRVQLEVMVTDAAGNPALEPPVGTGGTGQFGEPFQVEPGLWALPYRPPRVLSDRTERVVVTAGPVSTGLDLSIVATQSPVSIGLKGGVALTGGILGPAAGGELGVWATFGDTQLGLVLDVGWSMLSETSTVSFGGAPTAYESTRSHVPVLLSLAWRSQLGESWLVWVTAGAGGAWVQNEAQLAGQAAVSESGFAPAASGSVSTGPHLGPGSPFLEVRATWIGDPGLSTLSGSSFTFLGLLGYRFDVG